MNYLEALDKVIEEGIVAAKTDYMRPEAKMKLEGSLAGFEACRGKTAVELGKLLKVAAKSSNHSMERGDEDYWFWRCREAEIHWVSNVISAILLAQGLPIVIQPTVRGVRKADEILRGEAR